MDGTPEEEKKHMTACLEFAEIHVNFLEDVSQKIMFSDLTKMNSSAVVEISISGLSQLSNTSSTVKHVLWSYRRCYREQRPEPSTDGQSQILFTVASLFSRTMILTMHPDQYRSGFIS